MTSSSRRYILVTGANSGLGLGICTRLIDDFLKTQPASELLTIIFTTRSPRKSSQTLKTLSAHLARHGSREAQSRVAFQPESVELTNLLSVRDLARKLLASNLPYLNTIILNAGIGGWSGMNWPVTIWTVLTEIRQATTWPTYKLGVVGLVTKPQLPLPANDNPTSEPPLGEVFCANVFGHYMLAHWLMPLLWSCDSEEPGKIIWISSVEGRERHYNPTDPQGLRTADAYEHTKRLTDLLVVASQDQPATSRSISSYISPSRSLEHTQSRTSGTRPTMHVVHPGICTTAIVALYWIVQQAYVLGIYLARWCGSPWATCSPYTAALVATWVAFASPDELQAKEAEDGGGKGKWGTAVDLLGNPSVRRTDIEGWGINGSGHPFKSTWWGGSVGRVHGATDASKEDVENFVAKSAGAWEMMETLRMDWEKRLEEYDAMQQPLGT